MNDPTLCDKNKSLKTPDNFLCFTVLVHKKKTRGRKRRYMCQSRYVFVWVWTEDCTVGWVWEVRGGCVTGNVWITVWYWVLPLHHCVWCIDSSICHGKHQLGSVSVPVCKIQARMWTEWNPALYIASGHHWKPRFCHNLSLTQGLPVYV